MHPPAVARVTLTWTQEGRREWGRAAKDNVEEEHDSGWEKMVKLVQNREAWRSLVGPTRFGEKEGVHEGGKD